MSVQGTPEQLVGFLEETIVALVRRDSPDLTARQFSSFPTVYLNEGPHTVSGLSAALNISKPAVTRSIDRLVEFDFVRRKANPKDRRSVHIQRTEKGAALLREIRAIVDEATASEEIQAAASDQLPSNRQGRVVGT